MRSVVAILCIFIFKQQKLGFWFTITMEKKGNLYLHALSNVATLEKLAIAIEVDQIFALDSESIKRDICYIEFGSHPRFFFSFD